MSLADTVVPRFDPLIDGTRQYLRTIPAERLGWAPHEKSRSIGALGSHLAGIPGLVMAILGTDDFDINPPDGSSIERPEYHSPAAMIDALNENATAARAALASATDEQLMEMWTLRSGGHEVFTMPRIAALRLVVIEHMVHHGGQMTVYLRLLDLPVPQVFGPTADYPEV